MLPSFDTFFLNENLFHLTEVSKNKFFETKTNDSYSYDDGSLVSDRAGN